MGMRKNRSLEVEDFVQAITMRCPNRPAGIDPDVTRWRQMITGAKCSGVRLRRILDEKTNPWGITVQSVEIRDVRIPRGLEGRAGPPGPGRAASAGREHSPGTGRKPRFRKKFAQAALTYQNNPVALHLRAMAEICCTRPIKERGSMVIVPSSVVETMGLSGTLATTALKR